MEKQDGIERFINIIVISFIMALILLFFALVWRLIS